MLEEGSRTCLRGFWRVSSRYPMLGRLEVKLPAAADQRDLPPTGDSGVGKSCLMHHFLNDVCESSGKLF